MNSKPYPDSTHELAGCGERLRRAREAAGLTVEQVGERLHMPARVVSMHVAGHYVEAPDLLVDTHGAPVVDPVWDLLQAAYRHCGPKPTVLERDFNLPPYPELAADVARIRALQQRALTDAAIATRQAHG